MSVSKPDFSPQGLLHRAVVQMRCGDDVGAITAAVCALAAVAVALLEEETPKPPPMPIDWARKG